MNLKEADKKYIANTYARFPLEIVSGKGALCYDEQGREYIDLGSGIAVNSFGFSDEKWAEAVSKQANKLQHTSNLYYTEPCVNLAKALCEKTGMKKVFFSNSGAEANECAIKAARYWGAQNKGEDYYTIVTLVNSFHGRTVTTLAATGQDVFHKDFLPLTDGFAYAEANNSESLINVVNNNKCVAIMMESVQGEGGVLPLTQEFVDCAVRLSKEHNLLLIFDEVQTGNGRTGKMYGYMNYNVNPHIITTAKGLGGGLPIGATMLSKELEDLYQPSMHGSTFGGNPVCCAGALSIVERIDSELLDGVSNKSRYIFSQLEGASGVKSVTGMGLMIGIETVKDASEVVAECMKNGVLVLKAKTKVRLLPPLNIEQKQLEKAINVLKSACAV